MIGIVIFMAVYVKFKARGKVACVFFDTRRIYSMLLEEDVASKCVWRGKEDNPNRERYNLVADKVFEITWPSGLPWFMQERLRAWLFTRNNDEPWDPSNMRVTMSARMNRMISDEALLRTMWRDLRQSTGAGGGGSGGPMSMQMMLFFGFIALIAGIGLVFTWQVSGKVTTEMNMLTIIHQMLVNAGMK
jgi:hypothetical protein